MGTLAFSAFAIVLGVLALVAFGPDLLSRIRRMPRPRWRRPQVRESLPDPGRELRAERKAEELLRSVAGPDAYELYKALGFLHLAGPDGADGRPSYGYLIYPHRPIVSFDAETGELLSEHCVTFPDRAEDPEGERLPDADDVLAKWMALRGDERRLIAEANMHLPGRQHDPTHLRRDVARLSEWASRAGSPVGRRLEAS
jgi:hypothetical protein